MGRSLVLQAVLLALLTACSSPDKSRKPVTQVNGSLPVLAAEPLWAVGHGGGVEFSEIAGAALLSDGRVVIADSDGGEVLLVGGLSEGDSISISRVGRRGSGPGEYRSPRLIGVLPGGRSVIADAMQHRVLVFGSDGKVLATHGPGSATTGVIWTPVGAFDDGSLVQVRAFYGPPERPGTLTRLEASVVRTSPSGELLTDYGRFPWMDHINQLMDDGETMVRGPQFLAWRLQVTVRGDRMAIGAGNGREVLLLGRDGDTLAVMNVPGERRAVSDELRQAVRIRAEFEHAQRSVTAPERFADSLPYFGRIVLDSRGRVWVMAPHNEWLDPDSVTVFGADGALLGRLAVPGGVVLQDIGDSVAVGVSRTEDGVPVVVGYGVGD